MNKKWTLLLLLALFMLLLPLITVGAQNLQNNENYRESLRYRRLSEEAIEEGEYDKAIEYAEKSKEFSQKSEEYIKFMMAKYRANSALWKARNRRSQVRRADGDISEPGKFSEAEELIEKADELFQEDAEESFKESQEASVKAVEILDSIEPPESENLLPAAYVVRDMPGEEDCFWRISSYDFIYDDPAGWWPIYQANKDKLPEPDNPDLIRPGMVMEIPEKEGENRHGVWVDGEIEAEAP